MKYSRKTFLKLLSTGAAASIGTSFLAADRAIPPGADGHFLKLGLASYTLRSFSLEETIAMSQRLGLKHVAFKSMHMPLDADQMTLKSIRKKVMDAGLNLYGAGVVYMKSEDQVNQAFTYAKNAGLSVIIGVPNHELLPLVEKRVKETDIKVAIHNHGPGDNLYSSPDDTHEKIKDLDVRIGHCIDIGHVVRINQDPIEKLKKYKDRLWDVHIKDVDKNNAEGHAIEFGRGIIDLPKVIKTLKKMNYQGIMAIEYEKDGKDPLVGLAESVGYTNAIMDMLEV